MKSRRPGGGLFDPNIVDACIFGGAMLLGAGAAWMNNAGKKDREERESKAEEDEED